MTILVVGRRPSLGDRVDLSSSLHGTLNLHSKVSYGSKSSVRVRGAGFRGWRVRGSGFRGWWRPCPWGESTRPLKVRVGPDDPRRPVRDLDNTRTLRVAQTRSGRTQCRGHPRTAHEIGSGQGHTLRFVRPTGSPQAHLEALPAKHLPAGHLQTRSDPLLRMGGGHGVGGRTGEIDGGRRKSHFRRRGGFRSHVSLKNPVTSGNL